MSTVLIGGHVSCLLALLSVTFDTETEGLFKVSRSQTEN